MHARLKSFRAPINCVFRYGHTFDDVLTLRTILFIPKRRVKEERIREVLKECDLPADNIEKAGPRMYNIRKSPKVS